MLSSSYMPRLQLDTRSLFVSSAPPKPDPSKVCSLVATAIVVLVCISVMCSGLISNANIYAAVAMFWVPHINGWA